MSVGDHRVACTDDERGSWAKFEFLQVSISTITGEYRQHHCSCGQYTQSAEHK